jgi:hypothetical protein
MFGIRLVSGKTSTAVLIVYAAALMLLGSALPTASFVLGLTSYDVLHAYQEALLLRSPSFIVVYNSLFLFTLSRSVPSHVWSYFPSWQQLKSALKSAASAFSAS